MITAEISFCENIAFNIKCEDTKKAILDDLEQKYNIRIITRHFDNFQEHMLTNLNNNPHLVCAKSNGNPYYLYLTTIENIQYCIYIDKKVQQGYSLPRMIITQYNFSKNLFDDTVFDGEMIKTNTRTDSSENTSSSGKWIFLIGDLCVYQGMHLKEFNIVRRLNMLYNCFKTNYKPDDLDIASLYIKKYFKYSEINELVSEHIPKLPYTCRGIYFKPLFLRFRDILVNFDESLVKKVDKVKSKKNFQLIEHNNQGNQDSQGSQGNQGNQNNQKEFMTRKTTSPDIYELLDDTNKVIGIACVPTMKISKMMCEKFEDKSMIDRIKIKYEYSEKFSKYLPVC